MQPFEKCPRFDGCSANVCPLDPEASQRDRLASDDECKATRRTRTAIAAEFADLLPVGGLLPREIRRDKRRAAWLALPEEERTQRLAKLKPFSTRVREPESAVEGQGSGVPS
jgi:hypothetical protein